MGEDMTGVPENKRVLLIVDDEENTGLAMKAILERAGYTAEWAACGAEAIEKVRGRVFDLVFLDIHLPGMNGLYIFRELKKVNPGLKVCIMTGWPKGVATHIADCLAMLDEGAIDKMLRKPFGKEEILEVAKELLG
jgi:DNA-binding response OmpR family regulator